MITRKVWLDLCLKKFSGINFKKHRKICNPKLDQEHPKEHKCLLCDFSTDLKSCLTKHIQKEHLHPVTHQCNYIIDVENDIHCHYVTKEKGNLDRHIKVVHIAIKYNCNECKKVFTSSEILERHIFGDFLWTCARCTRRPDLLLNSAPHWLQIGSGAGVTLLSSSPSSSLTSCFTLVSSLPSSGWLDGVLVSPGSASSLLLSSSFSTLISTLSSFQSCQKPPILLPASSMVRKRKRNVVMDCCVNNVHIHFTVQSDVQYILYCTVPIST